MASISNVNYATLKAAFAAVNDDGVITVLKSTTETEAITLTKSCSLNTGTQASGYMITPSISVPSGKSLTITGTGSFTHTPSTTEGTIVLQGGTYASEVRQYCDSGYDVKYASSNKYSVVSTTTATTGAVAKIYTTNTSDAHMTYATSLKDAFEAVSYGNTIVLLANATGSGATVNKACTLDTGTSSNVFNISTSISVASGNTLTIKGDGVFSYTPSASSENDLSITGGTYPTDVTKETLIYSATSS